MDASVGGKIIKLTIESAFSLSVLGLLANCIYESVREWRVRGYSRGGAGGVPGLLWPRVGPCMGEKSSALF